MQIQIEAVHFKLSKQLKDYIHDKVSHLDHVNHSITRVDVFLTLESKSKIKEKVVELKVHSRGHDSFIKKTSDTFEEAVVQCVNTMKQTLDKINKKERTRKRDTLRKVIRKLFGK